MVLSVLALSVSACGPASAAGSPSGGGARQASTSPPTFVEPQFSDDQARNVVSRMIEAHGGMERWNAAPSLSFTASMYLPSLPLVNERFPQDRLYFDNWRHYRVTLDPQTSKGYVELPFERPGATVGFDGTDMWALPYDLDPPFKENPMALLYFHYGLIALPWLTQQEDVRIRSLDDASMPDGDRVYHVVEMTFDPSDREHPGNFTLYIDPDTYRLRGLTHSVGFPVLPGGVLGDMQANNPPGIFRFTDKYVEVDGLVLPRSYVTLRETDDGLQVLGAHLLLDPRFTTPMDPSVLVPPSGADAVMSVASPDSLTRR